MDFGHLIHFLVEEGHYDAVLTLITLPGFNEHAKEKMIVKIMQ